MSTTPLIEDGLRRERLILLASIVVMVGLAWAYLWSGAGMDMSMPGMVMGPMVWTPATALITFLMWLVMMIAMMVPSAAPAVLLFSAIKRKQTQAGPRPAIGAGLFLAGYVAIWTAFSFLATFLQWALEMAQLTAMDMSVRSGQFAGAILLVAGLYQLTPLKAVCLRECQSPLFFLVSRWRPGAFGAFRMGLNHGAYCVGCCWALMALLFVGGIMNLVWIAGLAIFVALEKLISRDLLLSRLAALAIVASGLAMMVRLPG